MTLMAIVVGVGLVFIFMQVAKDYATGEIYDRIYVARDIALITDTLYALPGNVIFTYKEDIGDNIFYVKDNKITLNKDTPEETSYAYVSSRQVLDENFGPQDSLFIKKEGDMLSFTEGQENYDQSFSCEDVEYEISRLLIQSSNLLEPSFTDDTDAIDENIFTTSISDTLEDILPQREIINLNPETAGFYEEYNNYVSSSNPDDFLLALSLNYGDVPSERANPLVIYINDDKKIRNIACHMIKELLAQVPLLKEPSLKIVDGSRLYDESSRRFPLSYGDNVIYMELGNVNAISDFNVYNQYVSIAVAIKDALEEVTLDED